MALNTHIERERLSFSAIQRLFIEQSDCIAPFTSERALSFTKFIDISIDLGLFSEEKTASFLANSQETFEEVQENCTQKLNTLKLRFIKAKQYNARYKKILSVLEKKLQESCKETAEIDKKILQLSYRLVEEDSKKALIDNEIQNLIPAEMREILEIYQEKVLF